MNELLVVNETIGKEIGNHVRPAKTFFQRARGLMGKRELSLGEGLYIPDCRSIHTCFMKFAIDVVFIDSQNKVTRIVPGMVPYRVAFGPSDTTGVLEFSAGTLNDNRCNTGDRISFIHTGRE